MQDLDEFTAFVLKEFIYYIEFLEQYGYKVDKT